MDCHEGRGAERVCACSLPRRLVYTLIHINFIVWEGFGCGLEAGCKGDFHLLQLQLYPPYLRPKLSNNREDVYFPQASISNQRTLLLLLYLIGELNYHDRNTHCTHCVKFSIQSRSRDVRKVVVCCGPHAMKVFPKGFFRQPS